MPIVRRSDCVPLPMVVCPAVAVMILESRLASCVHCVENVACLRLWQLTFHLECVFKVFTFAGFLCQASLIFQQYVRQFLLLVRC